jgi:hypothetical protein
MYRPRRSYLENMASVKAFQSNTPGSVTGAIFLMYSTSPTAITVSMSPSYIRLEWRGGYAKVRRGSSSIYGVFFLYGVCKRHGFCQLTLIPSRIDDNTSNATVIVSCATTSPKISSIIPINCLSVMTEPLPKRFM